MRHNNNYSKPEYCTHRSQEKEIGGRGKTNQGRRREKGRGREIKATGISEKETGRGRNT